MSFCTLAVNSPYNKKALELSNKLKRLYVLTDYPEWFNKNSFKFNNDSTHIWQQKRHIIKKTLELEDQAVFIDSDIELLENIKEPILDNIVSGYFIGNVTDFTKFHENSCWPILDKLGNYLKVDWRNAKWISPMLFSVKKDNKLSYLYFLETLDRIAIWLRDNGNYIFNDGNTLGLACLVVGITPIEDFRFKKIYNSFKHLMIGEWRTKNILA